MLLLLLLLFSCFSKQSLIKDIERSYIEVASNEAFGSGGLINYGNKSYVITAEHVLEYDYELFNHKGNLLGELIYSNKMKDISIFELQTKNNNGIDYARPKELKIGDSVHYWCMPNGLPKKYFTGYISRIENDSVIIDAYGWSGCSGSLVYTENKELIGILTSIMFFAQPFPSLQENMVYVTLFEEEYFNGGL